MGLTALGFAHLVAHSFQYICLSLHLTPLITGTRGSVLPKEQADTSRECQVADDTEVVIFQLTTSSGALVAPAT